jgi:hypothetical protein
MGLVCASYGKLNDDPKYAKVSEKKDFLFYFFKQDFR